MEPLEDKAPFMIGNFAFSAPQKHNSEEDVMAASAFLEHFRSHYAAFWDKYDLHSDMECMMFALPYVADWYGLLKEDILQYWTNNHGMAALFPLKDK